MILRIFVSVVLVISMLFMPFWLTAILVLAGMVYFSYFVEATIVLLLSDLLYGAPEAKYFNITFVSFLLAIIILLLMEQLKKKLKFYN